MSRENALRLRGMFGGAWLTQALAVAAKLKVADFIENDCPIDSLASKTGTKPEFLFRVLRALASQGVFKEIRPKVFQNTDLSLLLRSDAPNSLRDVAVFYGDQTYLAFEYFEHQLRTGEIAYNKKYGTDMFSVMKQDAFRSQTFNRAMAQISYEQTGAIVDAFDFSSIQTLTDVGGGNGKLLAHILKRYPQMQGVLFEQAHLQKEAQAFLTEEGIGHRVSFVAGDFFKHISVEADAILMKYILHDWPDPKAKLILENCRNAGQNGTKRLLIVEQMIPPGNDPLYGKMSDLMMMTSFGSAERSLEDFEALFQSAGWKINKVYPTDYLLYVFDLSPNS